MSHNVSFCLIWTDSLCYGCNTKSIQYSSHSGNVPGLHLLLQVELLTPSTSGLLFLLCSSFVLVIAVLKKMMIFYYRQILYNAHPGTPMPNICYFLDTIISIFIKSITSIFLNIFPILFSSQLHIRPPHPQHLLPSYTAL